MTILSKKHLLLVTVAVSIVATFPACRTAPKETGYAGFVRREKTVFLMENHCHALVAWQMIGASNATVIHIDAHDDCRPVSTQNLTVIERLLNEKAYAEIFDRSDTGRFLDMRIKNADMLYDLGNFIYPALKLGLVSNVYWVVPQPRIETGQRDDLLALTQIMLPGSITGPTRYPAGGFQIDWEGRTMHILTLEDLPVMPEGCILDLDIDFFAFPRAMTDEHLIAQVNRNPEDVFRYLRERVPKPSGTTISASVWGGYLPLLLRFLADAAFDFYTVGAFPEDANRLLNAYKSLRKRTTPNAPQVDSGAYTAAANHFAALTTLATGNTSACKRQMLRAASLTPVYMKGFLDAAEALTSMKRYSDARNFIDAFEKENGRETYNSIAVRALLSLASGDGEAALKDSSRLTDWDSNAYTLLIHGSALSANGKHLEARSTFEALIAKAPRNAAAYFNIGALLQGNGEIDKAIESYSTAIALRSDFWQALENLGHIMLQRGELDQAELLLRKALDINQFSVTSANNLGLVYARQRKFEKAILTLRRGIDMSPGNTTLRLNLAEALLVTGEHAKAKQLCLDILANETSSKATALIQQIKIKEGGGRKD